MKNYLTLFGLLILFTSCVKDIDFDQASNLELTPAFSMALAKFEFKQTSLLDDITNTEKEYQSDRVTFTAFENIDQEQKNYLERVTILFDIQNPFDRSFELNFNFFDSAGTLVYSFDTIRLNANSTYTTPIDIVIANHPNILNATQAEVSLRLLPGGSAINPNDPKMFIFKTSGDFYLRIRT